MADQTLGITEISVAGFKSIEKGSIEIRPLTILAGANSSGKSSIMQPTLLMKQTLDASHDPGPLLLNGPHVQFTQYEQLLPSTRIGRKRELTVGYEFAHDARLSCIFRINVAQERQQRHIKLLRMSYSSSEDEGRENIIYPRMPVREIKKLIPEEFLKSVEGGENRNKFGWRIRTQRCFLDIVLFRKYRRPDHFPLFSAPSFLSFYAQMIQSSIEKLIHVPGLRGNPERTYRIASAQGPSFPGTFENYIAGLILNWYDDHPEKLNWVEEKLRCLNLTRGVHAEMRDDVNVELLVGRLPPNLNSIIQDDKVSIADVGFGVSQVLPVLVALAAADKGQIVYIEQPELHLHPRAQAALANVLADAAKRGVRVVIETHSYLLLQNVMALIAEEELSHEMVMLHWFQRDAEGKTKITSVEPNKNGAYGDWPEDFMEAEMEIQGRYLDAVAERELAV